MSKPKSLRGLYDLKVMLTLVEIGRPATMAEIKKKAAVPHPASISVSMAEKQGYVDHDTEARTWAINEAGLAHLYEVARRETRAYRAWEKGRKP